MAPKAGSSRPDSAATRTPTTRDHGHDGTRRGDATADAGARPCRAESRPSASRATKAALRRAAATAATTITGGERRALGVARAARSVTAGSCEATMPATAAAAATIAALAQLRADGRASSATISPAAAASRPPRENESIRPAPSSGTAAAASARAWRPARVAREPGAQDKPDRRQRAYRVPVAQRLASRPSAATVRTGRAYPRQQPLRQPVAATIADCRPRAAGSAATAADRARQATAATMSAPR